MTMLKVVEILAQSEKSWEDAAQLAVQEAAKTVRNIKSIYIKDGSNCRGRSDHLLPGQRQDILRDRGTIVPRIGVARLRLSTRVQEAVVLEEERDE